MYRGKEQAVVQILPTALNHNEEIVHFLIEIVQDVELRFRFAEKHPTGSEERLDVQLMRRKEWPDFIGQFSLVS